MGSELVRGEDLLSFAGIQPVTVASIPVEQHVGEKLHAYTRVYVSGPSSRVKDLVDLILIAIHRELGATRLRQALDGTFCARNTHPLPAVLPVPPAAWTAPYRRLARDVGIDEDMEKGWAIAAALLDPVLSEEVPGTTRWHPTTQSWDA